MESISSKRFCALSTGRLRAQLDVALDYCISFMRCWCVYVCLEFELGFTSLRSKWAALRRASAKSKIILATKNGFDGRFHAVLFPELISLSGLMFLNQGCSCFLTRPRSGGAAFRRAGTSQSQNLESHAFIRRPSTVNPSGFETRTCCSHFVEGKTEIYGAKFQCGCEQRAG